MYVVSLTGGSTSLGRNDKKLAVVVWVGGALILAITFGKLLWVTYFGSGQMGETKQLSGLLVETLPLFLLAVGIGVFVAWLRSPKE